MSLVREDKSDQGSLIRISINKYFFHYAHDADCDFNFFGGDVFSLSKFKYIFFLSIILMDPFGLIMTMSPVCNQPYASTASSVFSKSL